MITIWVPKRLVEVGLYNVAARSPQELAVWQAGVELRPTEKIIQADHMGVCSLPDQLLGQLVGAGGLAAGRRAGEHDDLCAGKLHFLGGVIYPLGIALLTQVCKCLWAAAADGHGPGEF